MLWMKKNAISDYEAQLKALREYGQNVGLSETEINAAMHKSLQYLKETSQNKKNTEKRNISFWLIFMSLLAALLGVLYCANVHKVVHNIVDRNVQEVIYPFMSLYRKFSLPLIKGIPSLTSKNDYVYYLNLN